jgi:hypothetical protein
MGYGRLLRRSCAAPPSSVMNPRRLPRNTIEKPL